MRLHRADLECIATPVRDKSPAPIANIVIRTHFQLMTNFADKIPAHYEKHAIEWDADRRKSGWNDKRWHDRFVEALPEHASVLDLGCGGGSPVAANLVSHGCASLALTVRQH